jgi:uridylate kinase
VDGIYDSDPKKNPAAKRFQRLTYDDVLQRNLQVMDTAAFALCRENDIPLRIYDMSNAGALMRILQGEDIGTLVTR